MGQVNVNEPTRAERSGSGAGFAVGLVIALLALIVVAAVFFFGSARPVSTTQPAPQQAPAPNINVQPPAAPPNVNVQPPPAPNINVQPPNVNVNPPAAPNGS